MIPSDGELYFGKVVHRRLRPRRHRLSYNVFAILIDCAKLDILHQRLRLFSHNRFNLFSLYDRDHGDGTTIESYLQKIAKNSGHSGNITRFMMLCYPRILGYAFNPLTTYFGLDKEGNTRLIIYEVNNTFGERQTYVLPAQPNKNGLVAQNCQKLLYVSPFNSNRGTYSFRATSLGEELALGIGLRDEQGPVMLAHFRAKREPLSDRMLFIALTRTGWMTVKVYAGIHYEAAKLWIKGVSLVPRPYHSGNHISYEKNSSKD
jgi:DUF1365 family protein